MVVAWLTSARAGLVHRLDWTGMHWVGWPGELHGGHGLKTDGWPCDGQAGAWLCHMVGAWPMVEGPKVMGWPGCVMGDHVMGKLGRGCVAW